MRRARSAGKSHQGTQRGARAPRWRQHPAKQSWALSPPPLRILASLEAKARARPGRRRPLGQKEESRRPLPERPGRGCRECVMRPTPAPSGLALPARRGIVAPPLVQHPSWELLMNLSETDQERQPLEHRLAGSSVQTLCRVSRCGWTALASGSQLGPCAPPPPPQPRLVEPHPTRRPAGVC